MRFRPCIDLHQGIVKQIVGSTLSGKDERTLETNFEAEKPSEWFAKLYQQDHLTGGHVIMLGPGNENAALRAVKAYPEGMQVGGGIDIDNAPYWLDQGASAVIVTSWVFHDGEIDKTRLTRLSRSIGKKRLVLDLSCRRQGDSYRIVTDRWQKFSNATIQFELLDELSAFCSEYLIHAVDVEGKCHGIESQLVDLLGAWAQIPVTYAGGIHSMDDIRLIEEMGRGYIDFTVGSALDIFGGHFLKYSELANLYAETSNQT